MSQPVLLHNGCVTMDITPVLPQQTETKNLNLVFYVSFLLLSNPEFYATSLPIGFIHVAIRWSYSKL